MYVPHAWVTCIIQLVPLRAYIKKRQINLEVEMWELTVNLVNFWLKYWVKRKGISIKNAEFYHLILLKIIKLRIQSFVIFGSSFGYFWI